MMIEPPLSREEFLRGDRPPPKDHLALMIEIKRKMFWGRVFFSSLAFLLFVGGVFAMIYAPCQP